MNNRQIPRGLRDLLPDEVESRRAFEKQAAQLFTSYGYREVITPTLEFLDVVENGTGKKMSRDLYLLMDREDGILTLRPEMTVSIARLAATHLYDTEFPQRLYYIANSFRYVQPHLAQYREFWQLGIELLGASGAWADAEVITLAVKTMKTIGIHNFKISLNQIGIYNSLLEGSNIDRADREAITNLVERKDLVELTKLLEKLPVDDSLKETIAELPVLHGGLEVLNRLSYIEKNRQAIAAAEDLINVYNALQAHGVIDQIVIDMGVLRGLDYYTGTVFEGYSPDLGYGLLGGGRYDNLMGQFGLSSPSTGFATGMDRLALVLKNQAVNQNIRYLLGGTDWQKMISKAEELRSQGHIVELDVCSNCQEVLERKLENRHNYRLIYIDTNK